jgi:protein phosphatase
MNTTPNEAPAVSHLHWFGRTDRGKTRPNNEDAFLGIQFDAQEVQRLGKYGEAAIAGVNLAFAVCDGMGGALAGEFASRIAVEKITAFLPRSFAKGKQESPVGGLDALTALYTQIHHSLVHLGSSYPECQGMETTLSLCWFTPGRMFFAHIGDSRIYHLPAGDGSLQQLSHDDTYVGWMRRQGHINEREARQHPRRKVLQKALGGDHQFIAPQVGVADYGRGDIFLLCSDGVVEGLFDSHLAEVLRANGSPGSTGNPANVLVDEAVQRDGRDNSTALVIQAD